MLMNKDQTSYRQIVKATSLFGGVQVFNILIGLVRSKIIAILLGPAGIGIAGLLTSTTGLISGLTNFGLGTSAVKNIASANETGDHVRVSMVAIIMRKLVWITGLIGAIVTLLLAKKLSQITFGNESYTIGFMWLSITLLLNQLTSGEIVLLQGTRRLHYLAKASLIGSLSGLIISTPLYYFLRIDGIIPALILTSITTFFVVKYFTRKNSIENISIRKDQFLSESKDMLRMGFMLGLGSLMSVGASYIIRIYINNYGSVVDVGLYTAAFALVSTYVGVVFTAMGTDFYPRLSSVADDVEKSNKLINQQAEIGILILAPLLTVFLIFIDWLIVILYSIKFVPANEMIQWAALGTYFKVISWCLGFLLLAKGAARIFFWTEFVSSLFSLVLNILAYHYWGLEGLGVSYVLGYLFYLTLVYLVIHKKFQFVFYTEFYKIFIAQFILGLGCFILIKFIQTRLVFVLGLPIISLSIFFSYREMDKRLGIKSLIMKYKSKHY